MIRGRVLPQVRDSLWSLVANRLGLIETGLELVHEALDCSDGQLGAVDGLARDAMGGPVLVLLAVEGDALLVARLLSASEFVQRVGDALGRAVPEAGFCPGLPPRLLVVGTDAATSLLLQVARLPVPALQACALEPFRVAGSERFAVRWLSTGAPHAATEAGAGPAIPHDPEFVSPADRAALWQQLERICHRIDHGVRLDGDRYLRRITWRGHLLGEVRTVAGSLVGADDAGALHDLRDEREMRLFADRLLRAHLRCSGVVPSATAAHPEGAPHIAAPRHAAVGPGTLARAGDSLRSTLAAARLSPEEFSALGGPAASAGSDPGGQFVAEDGMRSTTVDGLRPSTGRAD